MLRSDDVAVIGHTGLGGSTCPIDLHGVAQPLSDQLVVIASNDMIIALDSNGRRLKLAKRGPEV